MSDYIPPYTISNKMLELTASISEKVGKISSHKELESKPHLRRNNRIKSIHSSLKIEANSLSLSEVRDVIEGHLVLGNQKEIQEVKNAYDAYNKINLFSWLKKNKDIVHPLIMAAVFHYEFVFIHPFADGNGRMARLWHTALLYNWRSIFEYIPLESQIEKFQDDYYDAITKSHVNGTSDVFIEFILEQIDRILDDVINQVNKATAETSEYVKKLLDCMEYDIPYTANTIMEQLGLHSKETFRKNYLNPAMEIGLVQMTIPDKPNSRNQRYVKK